VHSEWATRAFHRFLPALLAYWRFSILIFLWDGWVLRLRIHELLRQVFAFLMSSQHWGHDTFAEFSWGEIKHSELCMITRQSNELFALLSHDSCACKADHTDHVIIQTHLVYHMQLFGRRLFARTCLRRCRILKHLLHLHRKLPFITFLWEVRAWALELRHS